ncbi:hypothetical protein CNR22_21785 [Sphingobacteriaceae bacterium]|nr:hypothetical protein CNR22_21785 [Sphingobacteriaceae bacterium]
MLGCRKDPVIWQIENLNNNSISVFGHGGMGIYNSYPMNSYESLSECMDKGVDGTEMDVCVTKDSVLILCHTQDLDENTDCSGLIRNSNSRDLQGCRFKKPLFSKANLIEASYFFERVQRSEKQIFTFDCKTMDDSYEYYELFARALLKHINKYKLQNNCFIESFNVDFLKIVQSKNKDLRLFLYTDESTVGLATAKEISLYGLTMDMAKISEEEIEQAHKQNLRIALFNASTEKDNLEAIQKNPDYIQSDKVEYLINALKE